MIYRLRAPPPLEICRLGELIIPEHLRVAWNEVFAESHDAYFLGAGKVPSDTGHDGDRSSVL